MTPYSRVEIYQRFGVTCIIFTSQISKINEQKLIQQNMGQTDRSVAAVRDALA
jgi:hypothetical protein